MDNYRFPKYAKLTGLKSCIMMRKDLSDDGLKAYYYRPCGEWGCTIKLKNYEYTSNDPVIKHEKIELIACSPEEFISENEYCRLPYTANMLDEAIQDIKNTNPDFISGEVVITPEAYFAKVSYKEYKCNKEKYLQWEL